MHCKSIGFSFNLAIYLLPAALLSIAAFGAAGCASQPPAHTTFIVGIIPPPGFIAPPPPSPPSGALLILPQSGAAPAPWFEAPAPGTLKYRPLGDSDDMAYGQSLGIVKTEAGYFTVMPGAGISGPLQVPQNTREVLVAGERDSIFAISEDGTVHRAANSQSALKPGGFVREGQVPGAILWDASGTWIAAAKDSEVFISTDAGKTFQSSTPAPGKKIGSLFVRYDGIVAAVAEAPASPKGKTERKIFLSRNEGKSWQPSAFQPQHLERRGGLIWNGHSECPATLSLDGRTWSADKSIPGILSDRDSYSDALFHNTYFIAEPVPHYLNSQSPAPPPAPKPAEALKGLEKACPKEGKDIEGRGGLGLLGGLSGQGFEQCKGAMCLMGSYGEDTPATRTGIEFFSNGTCDETGVSPDGLCRAGVRLHQRPTMAVVDRVDGKVLAASLPDACDSPHSVENLGGIGLVLCWVGANATSVFTGDKNGAFAAEGILPIAPDSLSLSMIYKDGTIVLQHNPVDDMWQRQEPKPSPQAILRGFVRAPRPLGDRSAWRELRVPGGLAIRPYENGQALVAIDQSGAQGNRMSLYLDRIGAAPLPLLANMDVQQNLLDLQISGQYIRIQAHPSLNQHGLYKLPSKERESQQGAWHLLSQDGRLIPESN